MFGTFTLGQIANSLEISALDLRRMITAGEFPQPDVGDPKNYEWNVSTVSTAFQSLTQASVQAFLARAYSPLPDGTAAIKPWMLGVAGYN